MNYKKVTALILASVMMASAFVGCSGGGDEKTSNSEGSKTETNSSILLVLSLGQQILQRKGED